MTNQEAKSKIMAFCAYQERSPREVEFKLQQYNLPSPQIIEIIDFLINENFLNEERFAKSFCRGKFRLKKWGKRKIKYGLIEKGINEELIQKGLQEIDPGEYIQTVREIVETKRDQYPGKNSRDLNNKIARFLSQKGYETDLIWQILNEKRKT